MYTGGAGGYTFYVRDGEQVVRQRRNNSNYGTSASRSTAQQMRRVKWGNLVNFYKAIQTWQPKAYENKSQGQTDYNIFMSLNVNDSPVGLTKDMALQGCSVVYAYKVSRGSIPAIERALTDPAEGYILAISLTQAISGSTTVGQFATDVIANNPQFKDKDNIAFVVFKNIQNASNYPYVSCEYKEVTLDSTSTVLLSAVIGSGRFEKTTAGNLKVNVGAASSNEAGFVLIHTRKTSGVLQVSTQSIIVTGEAFWQEYTGESWFDECVASYGVDVDVPLDPSFNPGTISRVTANSVVISNGDILTGQQTVRVYGSNLYGSNFKFIANNVEYTPLEFGDGYQQYSITANADIILMLNGRRYMSFRVEGITTPSELSGTVYAALTAPSGQSGSIEPESVTTGCLNYQHKITTDYPRIYVSLGFTDSEEPEESDITLHNASGSWVWDANSKRLASTLTPTDANAPVYVLYKAYIFFVGNY